MELRDLGAIRLTSGLDYLSLASLSVGLVSSRSFSPRVFRMYF